MAEARAGAAEPTLRHPWIVATVALVALGASWIVAVQEGPAEWEKSITRWLNDAPDWVAHAMWPVMQGGTLAAPFVVALVIGLVRRDWFVAGVVAIVGVVTWFGAQGVKRVVERERPVAFLADLHVREGTGNGLGYISGHSAMAAALAVVALTVVPRRWWPLLFALVAVVGIARVVHGVHLPADLVGGWAFGTLVGLVGVSVIDWHRRRAAPAPPP
jgi:membrane-associated phospholipid phosphatase